MFLSVLFDSTVDKNLHNYMDSLFMPFGHQALLSSKLYYAFTSHSCN
uniref:Uncharacterized protein n=1 Tax=Rhizophora mucronata TaxID=61149 RepID=A0A2P2Q6F6_RHIMU